MSQSFPWQVLKLIVDSAASCGIDFSDIPRNLSVFDQLLKRRGIRPADLEMFMSTLEKTTGRTDLSIIFARKFIPESIDDYLTLAYTARDLKQAVELLSEYKWLLHPAIDMTLEETGDFAIIRYQSSDGFPILDRFSYAEGLFSCIYYRTLDVTGADFAPLRIDFRHSRTPHHDRYQAYFHCEVFHDQPCDALYLPRHVLHLPYLTHDPEASVQLQQQARLKLEPKSGFVAAVNTVLDRKLADDSFTIDELASSMAMSRRSLQRRLKQFGITFSNLKNSRRIVRAREALTETDISVDDLAESLGFVNGHSFRQFFKKNTGMTISQFRENHLSKAAPAIAPAPQPVAIGS